MDTQHNIYITRAHNEINLSKMIQRISDDEKLQEDVFEMPHDTYYSAVISHAYYSIFYMAKAYLLTKNIKTQAPQEHKQTFEEFKKLVEQGAVDVELLNIYQRLLTRAQTLLAIFHIEKNKRGAFTYKTLPQANSEPAKESVHHAETFFKHIYNLCQQY